MEASVQAMREAVEKADLPAEVRHKSLWFLDKLPPLYRELAATHDSRHLDEITRHVEGMFRALDCPEGRPLATALTFRFWEMQERLGLPKLTLKRPAVAKKRKAG